jgi:hypothetical protein
MASSGILPFKIWKLTCVGQRNKIFKNEPEKLLKIKDRGQKTNPNKPKNEAEKMLKTRSCRKNEPKNKAGHVVENKRPPKIARDPLRSCSALARELRPTASQSRSLTGPPLPSRPCGNSIYN